MRRLVEGSAGWLARSKSSDITQDRPCGASTTDLRSTMDEFQRLKLNKQCLSGRRGPLYSFVKGQSTEHRLFASEKCDCFRVSQSTVLMLEGSWIDVFNSRISHSMISISHWIIVNDISKYLYDKFPHPKRSFKSPHNHHSLSLRQKTAFVEPCYYMY